MIKEKIITIALLYLTAIATPTIVDNGQSIKLTPISNPPIRQTAINHNLVKWYTSERGDTLGVTNSILVGWSDTTNAEKTIKELSIAEYKRLTPTIWQLTLPQGEDIFELSKVLYDLSSTTFAQPNMFRSRRVR